MEIIKIRKGIIKLDQFLKWAGIIQTGGEAKELILSAVVKVNGEKEKKRGRQLKDKDIIEINNRKFMIAGTQDEN